jgi:plastocyanin
MKTKARVLGMLLTLVLVIFPSGCSGSTRTVTHTDTVAPTQGTLTGSTSKEVAITISSGYAEPAVGQGRIFVWTNVDNKTHTVTNDKYEPYFEYFIGSGETVRFDLSAHPGVYLYYCRIHPNETAEIIVP